MKAGKQRAVKAHNYGGKKEVLTRKTEAERRIRHASRVLRRNPPMVRNGRVVDGGQPPDLQW
jgi:hypothetical protein